MGKPIGAKSIAAMIDEIAPGEIKLFPASIYKRYEGVRMRAQEAMALEPTKRFSTFSEPEGSFVFRVR